MPADPAQVPEKWIFQDCIGGPLGALHSVYYQTCKTGKWNKAAPHVLKLINSKAKIEESVVEANQRIGNLEDRQRQFDDWCERQTKEIEERREQFERLLDGNNGSSTRSRAAALQAADSSASNGEGSGTKCPNKLARKAKIIELERNLGQEKEKNAQLETRLEACRSEVEGWKAKVQTGMCLASQLAAEKQSHKLTADRRHESSEKCIVLRRLKTSVLRRLPVAKDCSAFTDTTDMDTIISSLERELEKAAAVNDGRFAPVDHDQLARVRDLEALRDHVNNQLPHVTGRDFTGEESMQDIVSMLEHELHKAATVNRHPPLLAGGPCMDSASRQAALSMIEGQLHKAAAVDRGEYTPQGDMSSLYAFVTQRLCQGHESMQEIFACLEDKLQKAAQIESGEQRDMSSLYVFVTQQLCQGHESMQEIVARLGDKLQKAAQIESGDYVEFSFATQKMEEKLSPLKREMEVLRGELALERQRAGALQAGSSTATHARWQGGGQAADGTRDDSDSVVSAAAPEGFYSVGGGETGSDAARTPCSSSSAMATMLATALAAPASAQPDPVHARRVARLQDRIALLEAQQERSDEELARFDVWQRGTEAMADGLQRKIADVIELEGRLAARQEGLDAARDEIRVLVQDLAECNSNLSRCNADLTTRTEEHKDAKSEQVRLRAELKTCQESLDEARVENTAYRENYEVYSSDLAQKTRDLQDAESARERLRAELNSSKDALERTRIEMAACKENLESHASDIEAELTGARAELDTCQGSLNEARLQIETHKENHRVYSSDLEQELTDARAELGACQERLQSSETRLEDTEAKVERLQSSETRLKDTEAELERLQISETELRDTEAKLERLQSSETRLKDTEAKLEACQERLQSSESERQAVDAQLKTCKQSLLGADLKLEENAEELEACKTSLQTASADLAARIKMQEDAQEELEQARRCADSYAYTLHELEQARLALQTASADLAARIRMHEGAQEELVRCKESLRRSDVGRRTGLEALDRGLEGCREELLSLCGSIGADAHEWVSLTMELQSACDQLQVEQERSTMLQAGLTANEATVRALNRRLEAADLTLQEDGIRTKRCYDEIQGLSDTFQAKLRGLIDNSWHKKCRQGEAMDACLDVCNK